MSSIQSKRSKRSNKPKKSKQSSSTLSTASLTAEINKILNKRAEKKQFADYFTLSLLPYGATAFAANTIIPLSPYNSFLDISQGVGMGDRIGDVIRVTDYKLRIVAYPTGYNVTTNPQPVPLDCTIYVVRIRGTSVLPTTLPDFFRRGPNTVPPVGTLVDLVQEVNAVQYVLLGKKSFKLGAQLNQVVGGYIGYPNNDYSFNYILNWDMPFMRKEYRFDDSNNSAQDDIIIMWIECLNADGTQAANTTIPAKYTFEQIIEYTDF